MISVTSIESLNYVSVPLTQSLKRQLSESRDSLQFSNKTCEQLEAKLDELERANDYLQRHVDTQQALIDQKTQKIHTLDDDLTETRQVHERLQETYKQLVADNSNLEDIECNSTDGPRRERSGSSCLSSVSVDSSLESDRVISELTERVQNLTYQKEKAEKQVAEVLAENETLDKNLEKTEAEIDDLTKKLSAYEDSLDKQTQSSTPATPKHFPSTPTPTSQTELSLPPLTEEHSQYTQGSEESPGGMSLFTELDSQFSSLQRNYDSLVQGCTCSASIHHKNWSDKSKEVEMSLSDNRERSLQRPLKELFDEMFATLKQSAQVADRLIERKTDMILAREE